MTLYERLNNLCNEKGIKGARMCTDLNISKSLMTDLKMGRKKSLSAETAQKIAGYFGVSVGYLLGQTASAPDVLDQVDIAFYGDFKELDEAQKEAIRDMVRVMRNRRASSQEK